MSFSSKKNPDTFYMSTFVLEGNPSPFQQYSYPAYSLEPTELDAVSRTCHGDKWQKKFSWRQLMCSKGPLSQCV